MCPKHSTKIIFDPAGQMLEKKPQGFLVERGPLNTDWTPLWLKGSILVSDRQVKNWGSSLRAVSSGFGWRFGVDQVDASACRVGSAAGVTLLRLVVGSSYLHGTNRRPKTRDYLA